MKESITPHPIEGQAMKRFWAKVDERSPEECWPWLDTISNRGYGRFYLDSLTYVSAHVYMYELVVEPIPFGTEIDHTCKNKWCVNPYHLEVVTHRENMQRYNGTTETHCANGHEYAVVGFRITGHNGRTCRECARKRRRKAYERTGR